MKLRLKEKPEQLCASNQFNVNSVNEIIVIYLPEGDTSSDFIKNYDVYLETLKDWKDMRQAFGDKDLIMNSHFTSFFEPTTEEDRQRGFSL